MSAPEPTRELACAVAYRIHARAVVMSLPHIMHGDEPVLLTGGNIIAGVRLRDLALDLTLPSMDQTELDCAIDAGDLQQIAADLRERGLLTADNWPTHLPR